MEIKVIIADDHAIIREGLKSLLEKKGVIVLDIVGNGREAVEKTIAGNAVALSVRSFSESNQGWLCHAVCPKAPS